MMRPKYRLHTKMQQRKAELHTMWITFAYCAMTLLYFLVR